jgi:antibiotic biosynthesis monooxygenase (ABM) superfamily enzyme
MSIHRTAVALSVKPGCEAAYLDWLRACPRVLGGVYARTGIRKKAVVMSGPHVIAHYEADRADAVEAAFASPEAGAEFAGAFGQLLDPAVGPTMFHGVLAWSSPVTYAPRHVALRLDLKPGAEERYLEWVRERLTADFEGVWKRAELARKEVLVSGSKVIAYYQARDSASVLQTFAQPESIRALETTLGPLLDLDPTKPMQVYEEVFTWTA